MTLGAQIIAATLTGLYTEHMVGFGSAHLIPFMLIEGGAKGADAVAKWWAEQSPMHDSVGVGKDSLTRFIHVSVPAEWDKYGRSAGPIRNQKMLDMGPDLVLAYAYDFSQVKGTAHMMRIAEAARIPVVATTLPKG
jgi:hypothetical protein